ncbi:PREDICTED: uncharacterized protein LOC105560537 [Vollenhovia emeryi]|uniref:uncharacterized protein LOC105560537 n=1 Tax=Vollenhovia emeryi TaxID=411798 RepID=UPI0005F5409B|nr:PREDICTED: uncharacterized protein LOC105560537 [Vollenhovia emeryi]
MGVDRRGNNYRGKCTACDCDEFELPPADDTNMCLFCGHHSPLHERVNETCIREENLMGNEDSRQTVPLTVQCASNTISEGNGTVSYEENTSDVQSASNLIEQQDNPTTAQFLSYPRSKDYFLEQKVPTFEDLITLSPGPKVFHNDTTAWLVISDNDQLTIDVASAEEAVVLGLADTL